MGAEFACRGPFALLIKLRVWSCMGMLWQGCKSAGHGEPPCLLVLHLHSGCSGLAAIILQFTMRTCAAWHALAGERTAFIFAEGLVHVHITACRCLQFTVVIPCKREIFVMMLLIVLAEMHMVPYCCSEDCIAAEHACCQALTVGHPP